MVIPNQKLWILMLRLFLWTGSLLLKDLKKY